MSKNHPTTESEDLDRDPFEELATEFSSRLRNGSCPSIEDYATAHPDLADEIRDLFPTIAAMEKSKARSTSSVKPPPKPVVESLSMDQLGDFRLIGEVGRGGMGIVYEAEQISLGRHVAVKVLPKQALLDERHLRRFEREAQTAAKLHHTNIVPVFGVGQQDGFHYIVMQFIHGVGLDEVLLALRRLVFQSEETFDVLSSGAHRLSHANHNAQALLKGAFEELPSARVSSFVRDGSNSASRLSNQLSAGGGGTTDQATKTVEVNVDDLRSPSQPSPAKVAPQEATQLAELSQEFYQSVAKLGEQVANALAYAHEQGTLHRDIKPGNLLLDSSGTVWVADFGLAKFVEQDNVSRTGDIVGTLSYIPPESFSGPTDARGDIYSLGLSLFELLTLRPAFFGSDRGQLVREITEGKLPKLNKLNPYVPRDLETIILKSVAHRPEDRYASAADLANDLHAFLHDQPIKARRMSLPEQFSRWYRKNKLVAALSAAVLTLLVALTILFGAIGYQQSKSADALRIQNELAEEQRRKAVAAAEDADQQRQKARELAQEAIQAIESGFFSFANVLPLPVSADSDVVNSNQPVVSVFSASPSELEDVPATNPGTDSAGLVARPPISQETAARLEILLGELESLAAKAENYSDFTATFADLTLRVGMLHKALGNQDRSLYSLDRAIELYQSLVEESDTLESVIGLSVCYNEKADLLGSMNSGREYAEYFGKARKLLDSERQSGRLQDSPRAQYELARTLFLMSLQRQERKGKSRGPRFRFFDGSEFNLRSAIDLLKPLVNSESNSEYRYLLARCYSALGTVVREPKEREEHIRKANYELGELVSANPGVDDYKYEFAIAKLKTVNAIYNLDKRFQLTEQAVDLLDQVCGRNPDVLNYQIARSRALGKHVETLDQYALQMEMSIQAEEDAEIMGKILRSNATEAAIRAASLFSTLSVRYDDSYVERLPDTYEVELAEVIAKRDPGSAMAHFRHVMQSNQDSMTVSRAQLGLAQSLIYVSNLQFADTAEGYELLNSVEEQLKQKCQNELSTFRPGDRRFLDSFALWAEANYSLVSSDRAAMAVQEMRTARLERLVENLQVLSMGDEIVQEIRQITEAELDLRLAEVYLKISDYTSAAALIEKSEKVLTAKLQQDDVRGRNAAMMKMAASHILRDHYYKLGNEEDWIVMEKSMAILREKFWKGRPSRKPHREGDRPPPRDGSRPRI